jgi:predicted acylesterase/phospholipase RssA
MSTTTDFTAATEGSPRPTANKYCDIVMKGGITSGVVYPPAIVELSKIYTFKNIGGTSAGAIAAAVTAAAEYGRQNGKDGFGIIAKLPRWLGETASDGKQSNLFSLFQPQRETEPLFNVLTTGIGNKKAKPLLIMRAITRNFRVYALLGALLGLLISLPVLTLAYLAYDSSSTRFLISWTLLLAAILVVVGMIILSLVGFYRKVTNSIPNNGFGICSGFSESKKNSKHPLALTPWLSRLLNRAAGLDEQGPPLTFGQLWQAGEDPKGRNINLQMMTTNLTHGRPYRLPFPENENVFYFDPTEFRKLFPEEVVRWMEQHPRESKEPDKCLPLRRLPEAADLPVVVATRMSLSFPVLLSAVPLYAVDRGRADAKDRKPEKCWFSDGGICSNFPVHFFDPALPRWPAFAINLRPPHPDYEDPVRMPDSNRGGITEWWTHFDSGKGRKRLRPVFPVIETA